jgi:Zn-dependent peptidase ImmA (M78 family)
VKVVDLPSHYEQVAGFLDFDEKAIYVNSADHYNRQTFTIAHELGHYLMHKELFERDSARYKVLLRRPIGEETDPIEKEANAFAANLLVPMNLLNLYKKYATQEDLAQLFAVSRDVIGYRLKFARSTEPV